MCSAEAFPYPVPCTTNSINQWYPSYHQPHRAPSVTIGNGSFDLRFLSRRRMRSKDIEFYTRANTSTWCSTVLFLFSSNHRWRERVAISPQQKSPISLNFLFKCPFWKKKRNRGVSHNYMIYNSRAYTATSSRSIKDGDDWAQEQGWFPY
jgi:hypothetical protein